MLGDGAVLATLFFVYHDLLNKLVEDAGVELLEVGVLPDEWEESLHIVIDLFAGGDGLRQRFLCLQKSSPLLFIVGHHGLVAFLGDLLQRPVLVELVGDLLQLAQPFLYPPKFPPLPLGVLPLLGLFGVKEHLGVVTLCHRCPPGVTANILQHQGVQRFPTDGVGGAAAFAIVLIDPAGTTGVAATFAVIAEIERGATVGALDQSGEGLDLVAAGLSPPGFHHLVDGIPQFLGDQGLMGVLGDDSFLLWGWDTGFIKEALELGAPKHELPQVDPVVQDGSDGGGVPIIGLAPVSALGAVRIVLIEVCMGIEDAPVSEASY